MSSLIPLSRAPLCWGQSWRLGFPEGVSGQRLLPKMGNQRGLGSQLLWPGLLSRCPLGQERQRRASACGERGLQHSIGSAEI